MIRVLRVLEYRYTDGESMAHDMRNWGIGANATHRANSHVTISSAIMLPEHIADDSDEAQQVRT